MALLLEPDRGCANPLARIPATMRVVKMKIPRSPVQYCGPTAVRLCLFPLGKGLMANDYLGRLFLQDPTSEEDSSTNTSEDGEEITEKDREWMTTVLGLPAKNDIINLISDDDEGPKELQMQASQSSVQKHCSPTPGPSGLKRTRSNSSLPESYAIPPIESKNNPWSSKRARYSY